VIRIYVAMEDTLADYANAYERVRTEQSEIKFPQTIPEIRSGLAPMFGVIEGYHRLEKMRLDVWIISAASFIV